MHRNYPTAVRRTSLEYKPRLPHDSRRRRPDRRTGVVLLAVLIVIVVLTLSAFLFDKAMMGEHRGTVSYTHAVQARSLADSGVDYVAAILSNPDTFTSTLNSNPYNNPQVFQAISVQD